MGKLEKLTKAGHKILISGPYGTEVSTRVANDLGVNVQKLTDIPFNKSLGYDGSALLTDEGRGYLKQIAGNYIENSPTDLPFIIMTPTFRIGYRHLRAASGALFNAHLPSGLDLCREAIDICTQAAKTRNPDLTLIGMSIGPPFDCYKGEETPSGVEDFYLPQVIAAVRFAPEVDLLVFETVSSYRAARGTARAFTQAHDGFKLNGDSGEVEGFEINQFLGSRLANLKRSGFSDLKIEGYNPSKSEFDRLTPRQGYVISFCVEEDGALQAGTKQGHKISMNKVLSDLYKAIEREKLYQPDGIIFNCNSPDLTREVIEGLSHENRLRVIGVYPNASSERNPRRYALMTSKQNISTELYVKNVAEMVKDFDLRVYGGCCGTDQNTLNQIVRASGKN